MIWLGVGALVLALLPWRFSLLVTWGERTGWEAFFWSFSLGWGRLRDLSLPRKPKTEGKDGKPSKPRTKRRRFSLSRLALRLWRDRDDLLRLMAFSNRSTARILDALTRRLTVVLAGLDPMDQGWMSVLEATRRGAGWLPKVRVLNDWNPDAKGGAVRWDLGFCLLGLALCLARILLGAPWKLLWRSFGPRRRARN
jgi:hypothetical protein